MSGFAEGPGGRLSKESRRASITVDPADGGRLVSLVVDGSEVLGGSTPAPGAPPQIFSGSFVMAPFVGRTAFGRFEFEGTEYSLPANFGEHAMHGFVFDRPWRREGEELVIDLDERWPFGGSTVRQRFDLGDDRLTVTATIANEERRMPAILGFHPWFTERLAGGQAASFDFEPGTRYLADASGIPYATIPGGGDRPWDDSFADVAADPVVRWEGGGPELSLARTGSHWIVCETMPGAFCIEPLSGPVNGLATGDAAVVAPGSPLSLDLTISWR